MPAAPTPGYRLDLWSAPAAAGGTRVCFLAEPAAGTAVLSARRTRMLEPGRSQLVLSIAPNHPHLASLTPQQSIVRLTRFEPTTPDSFNEIWEEWRVVRRVRPVAREAGPYQIVCVPLEDDLIDVDAHREVSDGGLHRWQYSATERLPADVLGDVRTRLAALGYSWVVVGTVTPTTKVTFTIPNVTTPRAIISTLVTQLAAKGVTAEFQLTRFGSTEYRLELVARVAGALAPLIASTDAQAKDLSVDEDATEQVNVVIPFSSEGVDLRELQFEVASVDGGTGWVTLQAIGGAAATLVLLDDQWNGRRLYRELTGRSFAIVDSSASPQRVQLATADLASGLAAGERVSLRQLEDNAGTRRAFGTKSVWSPFRVVSTLTGPPRINTEDLQGAGVTIHAANQFRDWMAQRSTLVAAMPDGDFNHVTGIWSFVSAPSAAPAIGDWIWCPQGAAFIVGQVTNWNAGTNQATVIPRYVGQQFTASATGIVGARCYRPIGSPMWIQATATSGNQLTVDAFSAGTPSAGDVLEVQQLHQGERLVEVPHPVAIAASRRRVGTQQVECTAATNRVTNADLAAWAGASGDPPDGWSITSIVGSVTRSRVTDPLFTRYGAKAWRIDAAAGASFELRSPLVPIHAVPGMMQVAASAALLFIQFTGNVELQVAVVSVHAGGTRTVLGEAIRVFPPDTTVTIDDAQRAALDTWYDAVATNLSLESLIDEQLQVVITRPAGGSNPAMSFVLDAAMLLQREGLPEATEGGVQYVFGSDALPMLQAAQDILRDRASALLRFEAVLVDLYRVDGLRYAPFELVIGRDVDLRVPALALQRTVRLLGVTEDIIDPRTAQVMLDRVRPDVGRLLASRLSRPISTAADAAAAAALAYARVDVARTGKTATTVSFVATSTCPGRTAPQIRIASLGGGVTINTGPSVGTPAGSGQAWTVNKNANGSGPGYVVVETVGDGFVHDSAIAIIEEQGIEFVPLVVRARVISSTASTMVVRVAVADALPQGTDSVTINYQEEETGGVSPASGATVTPQATLSEAAGTYVDFTITRPAVGDPPGRVTFTASAANRLDGIDAQDVPTAVFVPAELNVVVTFDADKFYFTWSGSPAVQLKIGGGSFGAPPASPFEVNRPSFESGSDIPYNWKTTGATNNLTRTDIVLRKAAAPTGPEPTITSVDVVEDTAVNCDAGGWKTEISWAIADANNDDFYVEVRNNAGGAVIATNLDCEATGSYVHVTSVLGDPGGSGEGPASFTYDVGIKRRGTDEEVDFDTTDPISSGEYGLCV
jgi:hypothetical protein